MRAHPSKLFRPLAGRVPIIIRLLAALLLFAACSHPTYEGEVVAVLDGDRFLFNYVGGQLEVALADSYTVGLDQSYGDAARAALARLIGNHKVRITVLDQPSSRRVVARVMMNGKNVSAALVRQGYAWVSRKYADDNDLYWMELDARTRNVGLWARMEKVPKEP